ncbi:hypothetical protein ACVBIO_21295 [Shewanella sp. 0m-8]
MKHLWCLLGVFIALSAPTVATAKNNNENFILHCKVWNPGKHEKKSSYIIEVSPSEISIANHYEPGMKPYTSVYETILIQKTLYSLEGNSLYNYFGVQKRNDTGKVRAYIALKKAHTSSEWMLGSATLGYENNLEYMEFVHHKNLTCQKESL